MECGTEIYDIPVESVAEAKNNAEVDVVLINAPKR